MFLKLLAKSYGYYKFVLAKKFGNYFSNFEANY